ncbi:hypothetical protein ABK040_002016 [Willaertia magna]
MPRGASSQLSETTTMGNDANNNATNNNRRRRNNRNANDNNSIVEDDTIGRTINPHFVACLEELFTQSQQRRQDKLSITYRKALRSLERYPVKLYNGTQARICPGIGPKLAQRIDEYLKKHNIDLGQPPNNESTDNVTASLSSTNNNSTNNATNNTNNITTEKRKTTRKKKYNPKYKSAAWAILIAIYRICKEKNIDKVKKKDIIDISMTLTDTPMDKTPGSKYCGWSSMTTLTSKELVFCSKGRAHLFSLTKKGRRMARLFHKTEAEMNGRSFNYNATDSEGSSDSTEEEEEEEINARKSNSNSNRNSNSSSQQLSQETSPTVDNDDTNREASVVVEKPKKISRKSFCDALNDIFSSKTVDDFFSSEDEEEEDDDIQVIQQPLIENNEYYLSQMTTEDECSQPATIFSSSISTNPNENNNFNNNNTVLSAKEKTYDDPVVFDISSSSDEEVEVSIQSFQNTTVSESFPKSDSSVITNNNNSNSFVDIDILSKFDFTYLNDDHVSVKSRYESQIIVDLDLGICYLVQVKCPSEMKRHLKEIFDKFEENDITTIPTLGLIVSRGYLCEKRSPSFSSEIVHNALSRCTFETEASVKTNENNKNNNTVRRTKSRCNIIEKEITNPSTIVNNTQKHSELQTNDKTRVENTIEQQIITKEKSFEQTFESNIFSLDGDDSSLTVSDSSVNAKKRKKKTTTTEPTKKKKKKKKKTTVEESSDPTIQSTPINTNPNPTRISQPSTSTSQQQINTETDTVEIINFKDFIKRDIETTNTSNIDQTTNHNYEIVLVVDQRERYGGNERSFIRDTLKNRGLNAITSQLGLGDIIWVARKGNKEHVLDFIVERKAIDDLASSIIDGRYKEQRFRLRSTGCNNVCYLIEGEINQQSRLPQKNIENAMIRILTDGFSLKHTPSLEASINYLVNLTETITTLVNREGVEPYQLLLTDDTLEPGQQYNPSLGEYNATLGKTKDVLTQSEIFGRQLCCITGCSSLIAESILEEYPNAKSLIEMLDDDEHALDDLPIYTSIKGIVSRKLGSALSSKICKFYKDTTYD